jgi:cysteinyl-tRNA synthetase
LDPEGVGFDIHGGGADLIFPHHENEIAQSEPLMAHPPMANFWIHGGLLLFDSRKMSKSLGNFEPLADLLRRHDPQAIRLLFLRTGYRKVMNFTEESIASAAADLRALRSRYRALRAGAGPGTPTGLLDRLDAALGDDMNTAVALAEVLKGEASLGEFVAALRVLGVEPNDAWREGPKAELQADFVAQLAAALARAGEGGISLDGATAQEAVERVVAARALARAGKDWAASDRLRAALADCGVELHDSREGTTWSAGV